MKERIKEILKYKKKFFYEELIVFLTPTILDKKIVEETIIKNTRTINEKINKSNVNFYKNTYPLHTQNIKEDKNNPGNYTIKFYISKF